MGRHGQGVTDLLLNNDFYTMYSGLDIVIEHATSCTFTIYLHYIHVILQCRKICLMHIISIAK